VREDPKRKGLLYLGTERGVQFSRDAGKTWEPLQLNLPTVPVHDLVVKDNDLVVGTHGRSIWILDDLTPVRDSTPAIAKKAAHLFAVQPATAWRATWGGPTSGFTPNAVGTNPDAGAVVWYALGESFKGEVTIEVLDAKGSVVATAKGKAGSPAKDGKKDKDDPNAPKRKLEPTSGLNKFVWDLTHDGAKVIPGAAVDMGSADAPVPVAPGTYTVRLTAGNAKLTQSATVSADPRWMSERVRLTAKPAERPAQGEGPKLIIDDKGAATIAKLWAAGGGQQELTAQQELALKVRDDITKLSDTVARLRAIKKQIDLRDELLKERDEAKDLLKATEALNKKLDAIEEKLHNPKAKISYDIFAQKGGAMLYSQLAWLLANLTDGDGAPTKPQRELAAEFQKELADLVSKFEALAKDDLAKLNDAAKKLGVPELYFPPPAKKPEPAPMPKKK
jgi:hypothetical protein